MKIDNASPVPEKSYTYLALGDSYTIGEAVLYGENFPNQLVRLLRMEGYRFEDPVIIARTGWTTDELQAGIRQAGISGVYDMVNLLVGVNNQYRGRDIDEYASEFKALLLQAIDYAGGNRKRVMALSIPDWGCTPFAEGRDRKQISSDIDRFNSINERIAHEAGVHYINITPGTREAAIDHSLLAEDGLHPSAKEYAKWAKLASRLITNYL